MPVRNRLIAAGMVEKHHFLPESGWVTFHVSVANLERGLWLLRLSYLRYALREAGKVDGWASPRAESLLKDLQQTAARIVPGDSVCSANPTAQPPGAVCPLKASGRRKPSVTWVEVRQGARLCSISDKIFVF
jgi:hypothetical protein